MQASPETAGGRQTPFGNTGPIGAEDGPFRDRQGRCQDARVTESDRRYALITHAVGLLGAIDVSGFVVIIVTFAMWRCGLPNPFIDDHGKEATNFQLSLLLYSIALAVISIPLSFITFGLWIPFAVLLGLGLFVLRLVGVIRAIIFVNQDCYYRYPMCLRLIR